MKILKKFRENATTNPKTTQSGLIKAIIIGIIGTVAIEVGKSNEAMGLLITEHQEEIYGLLALVASWVIHRFGAKEDD